MLTPLPLLKKLQINSRQKTILVVIFLTPLIVITFAIFRLVETNPTSTTFDPIRLNLFSTLEVSCCKYILLKSDLSNLCSAIIAACLPSIRLFFLSSHQRSHHLRRSLAIIHPSNRESFRLRNFTTHQAGRPMYDNSDSAEAILEPVDKVHVRQDYRIMGE